MVFRVNILFHVESSERFSKKVIENFDGTEGRTIPHFIPPSCMQRLPLNFPAQKSTAPTEGGVLTLQREAQSMLLSSLFLLPQHQKKKLRHRSCLLKGIHREKAAENQEGIDAIKQRALEPTATEEARFKDSYKKMEPGYNNGFVTSPLVSTGGVGGGPAGLSTLASVAADADDHDIMQRMMMDEMMRTAGASGGVGVGGSGAGRGGEDDDPNDPLGSDIVAAVMNEDLSPTAIEDISNTTDGLAQQSQSQQSKPKAKTVRRKSASSEPMQPISPYTLIGQRIRKRFPGHGWFMGKVVSYNSKSSRRDLPTRKGKIKTTAPTTTTATSMEEPEDYYQVQYADGDSEDLTLDELLKVLIPNDCVGITIIKNFQGHGWFVGTVISYDKDAKLYKVQYSDGDMEELSYNQLVKIQNYEIHQYVLSQSKTTVQKIKQQELEEEKQLQAAQSTKGSKKKAATNGTTTTTTTTSTAKKKESEQRKFPNGMKVFRYFYGYGWYIGTIKSYHPRIGKSYRIQYEEDGDKEDLTVSEVEDILVSDDTIPALSLIVKQQQEDNQKKQEASISIVKQASIVIQQPQQNQKTKKQTPKKADNQQKRKPGRPKKTQAATAKKKAAPSTPKKQKKQSTTAELPSPLSTPTQNAVAAAAAAAATMPVNAAAVPNPMVWNTAPQQQHLHYQPPPSSYQLGTASNVLRIPSQHHATSSDLLTTATHPLASAAYQVATTSNQYSPPPPPPPQQQYHAPLQQQQQQHYPQPPTYQDPQQPQQQQQQYYHHQPAQQQQSPPPPPAWGDLFWR